MNILDSNMPLIFLGDNHGDWNELFFRLQKKSINNCCIISVGDLGIGFKGDKNKEYQLIKNLNEEFAERGIVFLGIRGNHDNPFYFNDNKTDLTNFKLVQDYSILEYGAKRIQLIGGAISIDRTGRRSGTSYWENEGIIYNKTLCQQVDILVTHTAPSHCFPQQFNEMVYGWAREDAYLLEDLTDERAVMDEIFKVCRPTLHLYGHFHSSWTEVVNGCTHKLLNINELWELPNA